MDNDSRYLARHAGHLDGWYGGEDQPQPDWDQATTDAYMEGYAKGVADRDAALDFACIEGDK